MTSESDGTLAREGGAGELEVVGALEVDPPTGAPRRIYRNAPRTGRWEPVTPLIPAQERLRALEEIQRTLNDALTATMESLVESEEDRGHQEDLIRGLESERDTLQLSLQEGEEVGAELSTALAAREGEELDPCADPCAGHLGPKAQENFRESLEYVRGLEDRLEELRPVVRAAIRWLSDNYRTTGYAADERVEIQRLDDICGSILVLTSTTRAWAEGDGEEE